ncbi:hypothetical protein B0H10DRAFT_2165042 [Mycena sp. CBHHK59/15]|nr:hypothetical protein B0H10DRAFT_2165042 [Mycena sp. CBHHK59/15]
MSKAVRLAAKFLAFSLVGGAAGVGTFVYITRKSRFVPFALAADAIFTSAHFKKFNPNQNVPGLHDLCVRRVPLDKIKPELLKEEGKLVENFCAGVWSGFGYSIQRRYLERKYRSPETAGQLWDKPELAASMYPLGTQITDHFEVISHTPTTIAVRCGDSPRNGGVRASDGVFEMSVEVKEAEGVADEPGKGIPPMIAMAHRWYTKLWMESALRNVLK